ncbi:MAG: hypothetical protein ABIK79_11735 [Chloroflexota bacterium]
MAQPHLTFACELEMNAFQALFADPAVMDDLAALEASVALGILDLTPERASVVRRLNQAGIPLIAWQLLPRDAGYWFNAGNARQATARYNDFKAWTDEHGLQWEGVGLDIEPDMREVQMLAGKKWRQLLPRVLRRTYDNERLRRVQAEYRALVTQVRADGYRVDSYVLPLILDERRAGSTLLHRFAGLVDVPADREIPMLYSSFLRPVGQGVLWSYAPEAGSVGIGSTGGGVDVGGLGDVRPLDWDEFSRDLLLAKSWTSDLFIFSLEGCVHQGFLARLKDFDWDESVTPPLETARQVEQFRKALRAVLWASAHPAITLAGLIGLAWLLSRRRGTRRL